MYEKAAVGSLAIDSIVSVLTDVERPTAMMRVPAARIWLAVAMAAGSPPCSVPRPSLSRMSTLRAPARLFAASSSCARCKPHTVHVWPLDGSRLSIADVSVAAVDVSGCTSVAVLL